MLRVTAALVGGVPASSAYETDVMDSELSHPRRFVLVPVGMLLLPVAVALPFIARVAGDAYVRRAMLTDPVPQNAMFVAFTGWCASIIVAVVLGVVAIVLIVFGSWGQSGGRVTRAAASESKGT